MFTFLPIPCKLIGTVLKTECVQDINPPIPVLRQQEVRYRAREVPQALQNPRSKASDICLCWYRALLEYRMNRSRKWPADSLSASQKSDTRLQGIEKPSSHMEPHFG